MLVDACNCKSYVQLQGGLWLGDVRGVFSRYETVDGTLWRFVGRSVISELKW